MPDSRKIMLALQEGFKDDSVRITVGNHLIHWLDHVKTRTKVGLAHTLELSLPAGNDPVQVELHGKDVRISIDPGRADARYWGVSVSPNGKAMYVRRSFEPFGYDRPVVSGCLS